MHRKTTESATAIFTSNITTVKFSRTQNKEAGDSRYYEDVTRLCTHWFILRICVFYIGK
jgi:hypothetical protein